MRLPPQNDWKSAPLPSKPPSVSVVIAHYQQPDDLARTLIGVGSQRGIELVDVTIADDGSPDPVLVLDSVMGAPVRITTQPDAGVRPAASRNNGAHHARGDVLVFLDADTVPAPDALAALAALPSMVPDSVTVGRRYHVDLSGWSPTNLAAELQRPAPAFAEFEDPAWLRELYGRTDDLADADDRSYQGIISAIMATSRSFFEEVGGFDSSIVGYGGEDWEFAYRSYCAGAYLAHVRKAVGYHNGPDWASRTPNSDHKNAERRNLFLRIPGADQGLVAPYSQVLVTLNNRQWSADQTIAVTDSLLRSTSHSVRVAIAERDHAANPIVNADSRVTFGSHHAPLQLRSLYQMELNEPITAGSDGLNPLIQRVAPGSDGRVSLCDGTKQVGTISATRALRRSVRHGSPEPGGGVDVELLRNLFGVGSVSLHDVGMVRCPSSIRLADHLQR